MRILIYGGRVIDPANHVDSKLNVLVEDGKIALVGCEEYPADERICADGKVVCPGFVDAHCHEDPVINGVIDFNEETSVSACMLRQGATTTICGNCGESKYAPADYLDIVDSQGAPQNIAMLAAYEYYRVKAGVSDRYAPADDAQIKEIAADVKKDLNRGCAGMSYGIRYTPGINEAELLGTMAACKGTGKIVSCHVRDDADGIFNSVDEFVNAAAALGVPAQISHIGSMAGFGQMAEVMSRIDALRLAGIDVMCDCYPYDAFSTGIGSTTYDPGWLQRYGCGYDVLEISEGKYKGQRCTEEIFNEVRRDFPDYLTVCYVMRSEDVELALRHPAVMLGSDATMDNGQGHPRAAGAFPRLIAQYVRTGTITLYDAINKMTAMPADRFGLTSKGRLTPGCDADIVVFDPEEIKDNSTFENPVLPPSGIEYVFVNGVKALEKGIIICKNSGRAVRT